MYSLNEGYMRRIVKYLYIDQTRIYFNRNLDYDFYKIKRINNFTFKAPIKRRIICLLKREIRNYTHYKVSRKKFK